MPDYGHPLRFGTFVTPRNAPPARPVELAVLSERLGFDLVTFQDHPYQPGFHDTWTLLSWVAARTSRIHVSGNVLNLPLRQPAVLARASASLDLLSGGRFDLGLGAGGFWDAIEAMGGRRLTPGQGVDALSEAIDIIRGIWDPHRRGPLRAGGRWHRVDGAKTGPAPAHEIPIWLGAYKPRMLRLTGRKADGWLPSLGYLEPGALAAGNRAIDDAATEAGRDPREITRLLNIPPQTPAAELARLALEDGISVFIVASDDERTPEAFAGEILPTVREEVDRERAGRGVSVAGRVRGTAARARRSPGIAYDELPSALADVAIEPGDVAYGRYRSTYLRGAAPGLVLAPRTLDQLHDAVAVARAHRHLPLGVLSAGHGISGRSINDGGLVLDVGAFDEITVLDPASGRVRLGPGARWADVARALAPHGLAISSGDYGGVGVGGLATAGGIGWFARAHGLTIDRMRAVDVVLADGSLVRASEAEEPDLFWAMRGAGANFGIAVSFEFDAVPVGRVGFAQLVFDATDAAEFLEGWGAFIERADRAVSGEVILSSGSGDGRRSAQALLVVDDDDPERIIAHLQPIAQVAPLIDQSVALVTYDQIMGAFPSDGPQQGRGEPMSRSGLLRRITPEFARESHALLDAGASHFFAVRAVGGAVADVPADATAYGWRDAGFSVAAFGSPRSGLDAHWSRLLPFFEGMYLSFDSTTPPPVERAFPPAHLRRLRELKRRYDPTGLFRDNFFIDPDAPAGA
ncbi:LLM class flavin-dependent oxidoreductase [Microbacterium sediminis]|uniref:FAD-linked oxidase n=1 Tax=Microbacterium sediminis TaxID=904291 RepID=A0A1B9NBJ4_9MICO|nr:LLM class flavin-dependent oxidoreductase [Microbacterium sediminis]OCG73975.1 FAD-linked oxidase [Microbacterium sediminis]